MSSTIQVGKRTFTTDAICEQLSNSDLLPQVLREMIIDEILADWAIEIDGKIPYNQTEFTDGCDRLGQLVGYQGLNQLQLYKIVDRHLRLQKFKQARWSGRVYSHYLQRKSSLDRVEFSVMGVTDRGLAEEIFFRVQSGEQSFKDLAFKYSECAAALDGGKISSSEIDRTHPGIAPYLVSLQPGELSPIFSLDNLHVFVRLEGYISTDLNDSLTQTLIDELFETWVQQEISGKLGLFELEETTENIPESFAPAEGRIVIERLEALLKDEQPEISELIEPKSSFFFPQESQNPDYDFEDPAEDGISSSFFFPKETPTQLISKSKGWSRQKIISFILFFSMFLGVEIITIKLLQPLNTPQINVGSSQIP
jgi:hypothetical protein